MIEASQDIRRPLWTLIGPALGSMLAAYQVGALLGPVRETLQSALGLSTLMTMLFLLGHLVALVVGVAAGFLLGRRVPTSIAAPAVALMLIGDLMMALAPSGIVVLFAVLVSGFGGGAVAGVALGLATQTGERRLAVLAGIGGAAFAGLLCGLVFGWFMTTAVSWRWTYFLAVPMALLTLAVVGVGGLVALTRKA